MQENYKEYDAEVTEDGESKIILLPENINLPYGKVYARRTADGFVISTKSQYADNNTTENAL